MKITDTLKEKFYGLYGEDGQKPRLFFAPGRVNLIGEHTDYNGGYVFPCALNYGTYLMVRETGEPEIKFASVNFGYKAFILPEDLDKKHNGEWVEYPLGVIDQLKKTGIKPSGLELMYSGDIPNGAGLSSSASIELVTAFMLNTLYGKNIPMIDLIKISQRAENEFVGMNCGIMDQFAVGMGQKDSALFLNCDTLDYELVPVELGDYRLLIVNTNKRRGLTDSKYNERRAECEKAVEDISKEKPVKNLSELSLAEYNELKYLISDEVVRKRASHVISENARVLEAIPALKSGNLNRFGELMNESHDSLRYDYEVTGIELDTLVEEARKIPGCIGSRMTGAGFGGCTVSIVHKESVEDFIKTVGRNYSERTGLEPVFYQPEIDDGPKELKINN